MNFFDTPNDRNRADTAQYTIIPAPFEKTVSYEGGTALGPDAILKATPQLEEYDHEVELNCCEQGEVYTAPSLKLNHLTGADASELIYNEVKTVLNRAQLPIVLGGEHTVSYGAIKACAEKYPDMHVVQVDAHADLRDEYQGTPYSHACVMRRVYDLNIPFHSIGIRAISKAEHQLIKEQKLHVLLEEKRRELSDWCSYFLSDVPSDTPIYYTIDVDGLDPAIMPSTGTPVPGGLSWGDILLLSRNLLKKGPLIGFDINEFAPKPGMHAPDFLVAQLLYKIICYHQALQS